MNVRARMTSPGFELYSQILSFQVEAILTILGELKHSRNKSSEVISFLRITFS
jgi:hypothetical protein